MTSQTDKQKLSLTLSQIREWAFKQTCSWELHICLSIYDLYMTGNIQLFKYIWQEPVDLVTFTEEILNGKIHFLCSERMLSWHLRDAQIYGIDEFLSHFMMSVVSFHTPRKHQKIKGVIERDQWNEMA